LVVKKRKKKKKGAKILRSIPRVSLHCILTTAVMLRRLRIPALRSPSTSVPRRFYSELLQTKFGQPSFETHPWSLKAGEVTPGISALEYATRRAKLASELPDGAVAVVPAAYVKYRSRPVFYPFHQNPDFLYLTGFLEPEALCVIEKTGPVGGGEHTFHLFVRGKDSHAELWDGPRSGVQAALDVFNADEAGDIEHAEHHLRPILERASTIYADTISLTEKPSGFARLITPPPAAAPGSLIQILRDRRVLPLKYFMHKLRVSKSDAEVANMRKAGQISGRAFNKAIATKERFTMERDLWAFLEYKFRMGGCEKEAYVPVIAGGQNSLHIHYTRNDDKLGFVLLCQLVSPVLKDYRESDLVLVDAGGQYGGYVTDITRTWPVSGTFTPAQRDLYQAVLNVQKRCVSLCCESTCISLDEIHEVSEMELISELKSLGFDLTSSQLCNVLFPHHVGHYVGLDIHDCGSYSKSRKLQAGQCVTVEPGVYVPNDLQWPKHFRGMGVRIEDTVCVGDEGPVVLSVEAVKEVNHHPRLPLLLSRTQPLCNRKSLA
ncbi:peptidase M24, structural domain-containing protein, partial [Tuber indicum]